MIVRLQSGVAWGSGLWLRAWTCKLLVVGVMDIVGHSFNLSASDPHSCRVHLHLQL